MSVSCTVTCLSEGNKATAIVHLIYNELCSSLMKPLPTLPAASAGKANTSKLEETEHATCILTQPCNESFPLKSKEE